MTNLSLMFSVLSHVPIPMFFKNSAMEYVWCNDAFLDSLDKSAEEVINKSSAAVFGGLCDSVTKSDERLLGGADSDSYELGCLSNEQKPKKFLVHKHVFKTHSDNFLIMGIMVDITEKSMLELEYKTAVETTKDGFWIVDVNTKKILDVNDSYCEMTGRTKEELIGAVIDDSLTTESAQRVEANIAATIQDSHSSFIAVHKRKNGSFIRFEISARYSGINGGVIFAFMKDITEKVKIEKMLIESEKLFRQFADNVKDVFWVRTPERMLYINKAFESVWGVDRGEVYKNPNIFINNIIEEDRERITEAFKNEISSKEHSFDEEYRIINAAGEIRWVHARSYPIFDPKRGYVRSAGIASDITAQKSLEETINKLNCELIMMIDSEMERRKEKEHAFEGIFDIAGSALCLVDDFGILGDANRQFLKLFDIESKEEIVGHSFKELISKEEFAKAEDKFRQVALDCKSRACYCKNSPDNCYKVPIPYEWRIKKRNGEKIVVLGTVACYNSGGKKMFIASLLDVTKIKELENMQRESERLLSHQSKMAAMGEMIGAIAHQWRQPLNLLGILVQNALCSFEDGELDASYMEEFASNAMKQIMFMSKTIDDFRSFFRNDKELLDFDVNIQVEKSVSLMDDMLKAHGIETSVTASGSPIARGYPNELGQAMLNLISNAKDAISEKKAGGKIAITVSSEQGYVVISVQDDGGGIDEKIIDRIFEPYFTTKDEKKGTGIGLYMSKTIIEKHMSGSLEVENKGDGAVFTIKIPLSTSQEPLM